MSNFLFILGALIAVGAAVAFAALGALAVYGAARATAGQIVPGFKPDRPGPAERALTLIALWVPVAIVGVFGVYAGVWIIGRVIAAFG